MVTIYMFRRKHGKKIAFLVQKKKKLQELIKMEKKLQKIYLTYYNLLTVQDLWQAHYQILSVNFLKEFIELNVNTDMINRKKLQNVFNLNLNKISRGRNKSKEQNMTLENIKLLYESRDPVIKLFNDYFSIVSEAKYKTTHGKGIPSLLARTASIAKVSDQQISKC